MIKRFDIVAIKTTKNIRYVSGPAGRPARPKGNWIVVAGVEDDQFLLAKDETVVKVPMSDVMLVASYDLKKVLDAIPKVRTFEDLERLGGQSGKERQEGQEGRNSSAKSVGRGNPSNPE